ncbi:MAG TPA: oligosaccharide flippase family protein [Patescibacteria group bacterium]|nr:oligosaccharide flippase family protein [Patescibacteria group bacterium]
MGYFKEAAKGIGWMGALRAFIVGVGIIKIAILARILSPSQFGIYGFSLLILGLLEAFTETGINIFLIQEKDKTEKYLDSAWVVSIARGTLIALVILATAPAVALFFKSPEVLPLLYVTSAIAFVRGFINPMEVSFQKNLQFQKEFRFKGSLYLLDAVFCIVLAYILVSPIAMVYGMLAAAAVEVAASFIIFKTRPALHLDQAKVKTVINRGKWITGAGTFSYLFTNIDHLVVGRLLGAAPLGLYQQAYRISTLPVSQVGDVFNKVTFPVYVKIEGDRERLKKAFIKTSLVILSLVLPFGLLVFAFSRQLILLVLGASWLPAEGALKVLAIFGIFKSMLNSSYSLFLSLKKQNVVMISELMGIIGIGAFILPLTRTYGLIGAAYAAIIGAVFSLPVIIINFRKVFTK